MQREGSGTEVAVGLTKVRVLLTMTLQPKTILTEIFRDKARKTINQNRKVSVSSFST